MKKLFSMTLLVIILSGCASIVSKSTYPVSLTSNPTGATIIITDKNGSEIYSGKTPTTVELESKDGFFSGATYKIVFSKNGYEKKTVVLHSKIDGWYFGNILFGGLIGMLIVDPATGAMWALPTHSNATLSKKAALNKNTRELRFVSIYDIPENYRERLIKLN